MSPLAPPAATPWICHCLQVTAEEIRQAIDEGKVASLEDVFAATGAGLGCTACHRRIQAVLESRQPADPV